MGSSSSRLFGTLAQTLTSAPLAQPDPYLEKNLDQVPDQDLDPDLAETDPDQLLRECEEALQRRPARPHRDLVYPKGMAPCCHKLKPSIRIMQWNILAQGRDLRLNHAFVSCIQNWGVIFWHANWMALWGWQWPDWNIYWTDLKWNFVQFTSCWLCSFGVWWGTVHPKPKTYTLH